MEYSCINPDRDRETITLFRRDSFVVSFGTDESFNEEQYLKWVREKTRQFPDGFVLALEDNKPVGQIELSIHSYEGRTIGYVNLFYLIAEKRGMGLGGQLQHYAMDFFRKRGVREYHLRVAPDNGQALAFYRKNGMRQLKTEFGGSVIRMTGKV